MKSIISAREIDALIQYLGYSPSVEFKALVKKVLSNNNITRLDLSETTLRNPFLIAFIEPSANVDTSDLGAALFLIDRTAEIFNEGSKKSLRSELFYILLEVFSLTKRLSCRVWKSINV